MSSFSETNFTKKLSELNPSQQSIQTLSLWLIHHRKHAKTIVEVWIKELKKVKPSKKLTLLYLANDVIQNSKKKGPEFNKMYRFVLPDAYRFTSKDADEKIRASMERMINIWKERGIFDEEFTEKLKQNMSSTSASASTPAKTTSSSSSSTPVEKPEKVTEPADNKKEKSQKKKKKTAELSLREEIELEVKNGGSGEPPDASDLVAALQDLENTASSDAGVREKIAALPPEVSDIANVDRISNTEAASKLKNQVEEACTMLTDYNGRLADELQERRRVGKMLKEYIISQKQSMTDAEKLLEEHKSKLDQVSNVRKELKSHIQSLPDLTLLPHVTGGLAPLPSAGDLFAIEKDL